MKTNFKKTIWSILTLVCFLTLAGASGCEGDGNRRRSRENNDAEEAWDMYSEDMDTLETSDETEVPVEEYDEEFSSDVEEDQREEEEIYQSESEDEQAEEYDNENEEGQTEDVI